MRRGSRVGGCSPKLLGQVVLVVIAFLLFGSSVGGQQTQTPAKEYIRIGDRVVAVENGAAVANCAISLTPSATSTGSLDTVQITATITPSACTSNPITWTATQGTLSSISASTDLFIPPAVTTTTPVTIMASILNASVSNSTTIQVIPVLNPQSATVRPGT
jgi:hypothetical protein